MVGDFKLESSLLGKRCNFSLFPCLATSELPYQELRATVLQNRCPTEHWMPLGPQIIQEGCTARAVVSVGSCQSMGPNRDSGKNSGSAVPVPRTGQGLGDPQLGLCLGYSEECPYLSEGHRLRMVQRKPSTIHLDVPKGHPWQCFSGSVFYQHYLLAMRVKVRCAACLSLQGLRLSHHQ